MLDINQLSVVYDGASEPVLEGINLKVAQGEFVSLVGPSGCGKSTLLRVIMGLQQASQGGVKKTIDQKDVGFLFQDDALLPWRSVDDNISLGLRINGMDKAAAHEKAAEWRKSLGLKGLGKRYPSELSGGQRKRVAIAQVLAMNPTLLLMDEPFSSLDAIVRHYITQDLLSLVENQGLTVVMVTHDLEEAATVSDRVVMLSNGPRANIKMQLPVELERPRDLIAVRQEPAFNQAVKQLWQGLSEEIVLEA